MRIIQSFWNNGDKLSGGGFPKLQHHLCSWALSSLTISQFYPNLNLATDTLGKHILIDCLELPYRDYSLPFDNYRPLVANELWTVKKLLTYSLQTEGFIHLDGDVYLWKSLPQRILTGELIAQNRDVDIHFYNEAYKGVIENFINIPAQITNLKEIWGANAGIIGGTNHRFFKEMYSFVSKFLEDNRDVLKNLNGNYFSTFLEQSLYYYLAKDSNIEIEYLFDFIVRHGDDPPLQQFTQLPNECDYIHIMLSKSNPLIYELLEQRFRIDFNKYYELINRYLSSIERYQIATNEIDENTLFYRTKNLCELIFGDHPIIKFVFSARDFPDQLHNSQYSLTNREISLVQDVHSFEYSKYELLSNFNWSTRLPDLSYINHVLYLGIDELRQRIVSISNSICLIESEWPWADEKNFTLNKQRLKSQLTSEPAYFLTAIIPLHSIKSFYEYQLDISGILLLDLFSKPCTVAEAYKELISKINEDEISEARFLYYLRFFLYLGILEFKKA